jgi:hypothetical protein
MKKVTIYLLLLSSTAYAKNWNPRSGSTNQQETNRAGCAPAQAVTYMELNNVRALLETGGRMWTDRFSGANGVAAYEVPKGSDKTAIYAGSLWLGGKDINGQLKIAGNLYSGYDFWTGPLQTDGTAQVSENTCSEYDRFWQVSREMVEEFVAQYACNFCDSDYKIPEAIINWPGNGGPGESHYLAPFYDANMDGWYNPLDGDYPHYDLNKNIDCSQRKREDRATLYGDQTYWWVFNDNGNIHSSSGGQAIGMEIRAQAFAFSTNDEVNNMTFYNYELINQGTTTLYDTYFGVWVDPDIGFYDDDYIGCDVQRGLGYCYNGPAVDQGQGVNAYGANPPAIGVDFFEGPYMDYDQKDNIGPNQWNGYYVSCADAAADNGIPYKGLGVGFGDSIIDNERYGMRNFFYFNGGSSGGMRDPENGVEMYNYMSGFWADGSDVLYGGTGYSPSGQGIKTNYCFPGDSDPQGWATACQTQATWTEQGEGNAPGDRRMVQSAGPFTLEPGAKNDITLGVVYARALSGDPFESVEQLRIADDKAQALFDNCFRILDGPHAPDLTVQELDKSVILTISNDNPVSNNQKESYQEIDPFLPDSVLGPDGNLISVDKMYRFQGYKIYQLKNEEVSTEDLDNPDLARLVYQGDLKDSIDRLINWELDGDLGVSVPYEKVNGTNEGVENAILITEDKFAESNTALVNYKKYHYMALSYATNIYLPYIQDDPQYINGQKKPYLESRKAPVGSIKRYTAIPHKPASENLGTHAQSVFGEQPFITRIEGQGNGGHILEFTPESEQTIVEDFSMSFPQYQKAKGPVSIRVIDPLNLPGADFKLYFMPDVNGNLSDLSNWELHNLENDSVYYSDKSISVGYDQIIPEIGLAVQIEEPQYYEEENIEKTSFLGAEVSYLDSSKAWLDWVYDTDGFSFQNWIRCGTQEGAFRDYPKEDNEEQYEIMLEGAWSFYRYLGDTLYGLAPSKNFAPTRKGMDPSEVHSVQLVITADTSKWTRSPVIELGDNPESTFGNAQKGELRLNSSVFRNGKEDGTGTGMSWFPGYALDLETGERLNIAFGENSSYGIDNGRDMLWNPTSQMGQASSPINGGFHAIYIIQSDNVNPLRPGTYDGGQEIEQIAKSQLRNIWYNCAWVGFPRLVEGEQLFQTDVKISLHMEKRHDTYLVDNSNGSLPQYMFSTKGMETLTDQDSTAIGMLENIHAVPNPYYGHSKYEVNRLDNRIKIVNLPERCDVSIYSASGQLIRQIRKDDPSTFVEWDLKNYSGIPIAGGSYIIHIDAPGVGESIIKWFGVLRPTDLDNF